MKQHKVSMTLVGIAVTAALAVLSGCGSPPGGSPSSPSPTGQPSGAPAAGTTAQLPDNAKTVYTMDLSTTSNLYAIRSIKGLKVSEGVLSFTTSSIDPNVTLYQSRLARGLQSPLWLKVEMSGKMPTEGRVYVDTGKGFSEKEATTWKLSGDGQMHTYVVQLKGQSPVLNIRFDPSEQDNDEVSIRQFEILSGG